MRSLIAVGMTIACIVPVSAAFASGIERDDSGRRPPMGLRLTTR